MRSNFGNGYENVYTAVPGAPTAPSTDTLVTPYGNINLDSLFGNINVANPLDPADALTGLQAGDSCHRRRRLQPRRVHLRPALLVGGGEGFTPVDATGRCSTAAGPRRRHPDHLRRHTVAGVAGLQRLRRQHGSRSDRQHHHQRPGDRTCWASPTPSSPSPAARCTGRSLRPARQSADGWIGLRRAEPR